ncbi:MAG: Twin-arginine translocase TatA/TatE family subunit [Phycisphaerales bacterium]|nr:Twin-arginine translocase TatA/TatE family subunit [Phycisphaerales bacterium]
MPVTSLAVGTPAPVLAIMLPQGYEWLFIATLALLFFGKRLPGAARGIGQGIQEFKKGMKDGDAAPADDVVTTAPQARFDPHTGKPLA